MGLLLPEVPATHAVVKSREGYKIFIDDAEKERFDALVEKVGTTQREAATRLFRWFLQLDQTVQFGVLDLLPEGSEVDILSLTIDRLRRKYSGVGMPVSADGLIVVHHHGTAAVAVQTVAQAATGYREKSKETEPGSNCRIGPIRQLRGQQAASAKQQPPGRLKDK